MRKNIAIALLSAVCVCAVGGGACAAAESPRASVIGSVRYGPRLPSIPITVTPAQPDNNYTPPPPEPTPTPTPEPEPEYPAPPPPPDFTPPPPPSKPKAYTIDDCMRDLSACVKTTLPGGITDLYDSAMRGEILANANLCRKQTDYCIANVRGRRHQQIYATAADVWMDFNSRVIVPGYYAFVIRQTGLSPNQAEHVCLMLDNNVSGSPSSANLRDSAVTKTILGGNGITITSSKWVSINDRMTGNARWDAARAECQLRVSAYNKDNPITNSWLFGIAGDDRQAEVWKKAGDVFTCNKDLFGFGLMTNTKTVAVVGIGGGTVVGAGAGAIIGHNTETADGGNKTGEGALIGAGAGAAAGGVATLITSFVERNNINCRIGDNLQQIGYNKSGQIYSLKDFYTKWNLNLPESVTPDDKNTPVDSCEAWKAACYQITDAYLCGNAQIRTKNLIDQLGRWDSGGEPVVGKWLDAGGIPTDTNPPTDANPITIDGACIPISGRCVPADAVTFSREVCE
ncbi:MAG: hypothetical protein FWC61_00070 [Proteobacteria bacterium]|nr:hypothetical protein [Pseudomonadota bacterium]